MTNNEIIRYSDKELAEFESIINSKLDQAKKELAFYTEQLKQQAENTDSKLKGLDDGVSATEVERMNTLASRNLKHIQHLENAKLRILNKVYGVCRFSGNLISKARLRAVPHATLSIEAKQNRKRQ